MTRRASNAIVKAEQEHTPITLEQVDRWMARMQWTGWGDAQKSKGVDKRLFTISPSLVGVLEGLSSGLLRDDPLRDTGLIVSVANRAIGTAEGLAFNRDTLRVLACVDWLVRFVTPLALDRLPTWSPARLYAVTLRALSAMLWTQPLVQALDVVLRVQIATENDLQRGREAERNALAAAQRRADSVLDVLVAGIAANRDTSGSLSVLQLDVHKQTYLCKRVVDSVCDGFVGVRDPDAIATLQQLCDLLLEIRPGDSRRSVADRCRWPKPALSTAAAVAQ